MRFNKIEIGLHLIRVLAITSIVFVFLKVERLINWSWIVLFSPVAMAIIVLIFIIFIARNKNKI